MTAVANGWIATRGGRLLSWPDNRRRVLTRAEGERVLETIRERLGPNWPLRTAPGPTEATP